MLWDLRSKLRKEMRAASSLKLVNVQSFNKRIPAEFFRNGKRVRVPTTKRMVLLIARNEKYIWVQQNPMAQSTDGIQPAAGDHCGNWHHLR